MFSVFGPQQLLCNFLLLVCDCTYEQPPVWFLALPFFFFAKNVNWHINTENLNTILYTEHYTILIRIYFAFVDVSNHYFAIWFLDDSTSSVEGSGDHNTVASLHRLHALATRAAHTADVTSTASGAPR